MAGVEGGGLPLCIGRVALLRLSLGVHPVRRVARWFSRALGRNPPNPRIPVFTGIPDAAPYHPNTPNLL